MKTVYFRDPNNMSVEQKIVSDTQAKKYINITTAPKCGTHLLIKILKEFDIPYKFPEGIPHIFPCLNLSYSDRNDQNKIVAQIKPEEKYIGTYRDPRDCLVSLLQWIELGKDRPVSNRYKIIPFDQKLTWGILENAPSKYAAITNFSAHNKALYVMATIKEMNLENFLVLSFESLIGEKNGGRGNQIETIQKILDFCETTASVEKISNVIDNLFRNTVTFTDTKKVGRWRDVFNSRHIQNFKNKHNELLLRLGYETTPNWHF